MQLPTDLVQLGKGLHAHLLPLQQVPSRIRQTTSNIPSEQQPQLTLSSLAKAFMHTSSRSSSARLTVEARNSCKCEIMRDDRESSRNAALLTR